VSRPGKFAKSSRVKQLRQFKRRKQQQGGNVIDWADVTDFLLGRYQLIQGRQLSPVVNATIQRFLSEWVTTAQAAGPTAVQWSLTTVTATTLARIGNQVPWQFYRVVLAQATRWQHFLQVEGPAVPLNPRRQVVAAQTPAALTRVVAQQLAVNLLTVTATPITDQQRMQLVESLLVAEQLNWSAVAALFAPLGFTVTGAPDAATHQWLNDLQALTSAVFH